MANDYTLSSCLLTVPAERLVEAAHAVDAFRRERASDGESISVAIEVLHRDDACGVWFHDEESTDLEEIAGTAQHVIDSLQLDEPFVFTWARTCAKPRIGHFTGGACVVRRGQPQVWVDAATAAMEKAGLRTA